MSQQDLTSDLLTRIRNANRNHAPHVNCINSKLNRGVAQVLVDEGYIRSFDVVDDGRGGLLRINLKYGSNGEQVIHSIDRVSKPGRRVYSQVSDLPRPIQGLGIVVVSTSAGVLSDRKCRENNVGGEVVAVVT